MPPPPAASAVQTCLTIEADGATRCHKIPPHGDLRCRMHQKQYRTMTKRYKDASKIVDEMETSELPTFSQIATYNGLAETKRKASWMRRYAEAIRVEKTGREVHSKRFFLKG